MFEFETFIWRSSSNLALASSTLALWWTCMRRSQYTDIPIYKYATTKKHAWGDPNILWWIFGEYTLVNMHEEIPIYCATTKMDITVKQNQLGPAPVNYWVNEDEAGSRSVVVWNDTPKLVLKQFTLWNWPWNSLQSETGPKTVHNFKLALKQFTIWNWP